MDEVQLHSNRAEQLQLNAVELCLIVGHLLEVTFTACRKTAPKAVSSGRKSKGIAPRATPDRRHIS